ncbi:hypothetical protein GW17_00040447 [Ensete ventricosum]|nr:hypothetical protein GW17_00040447 [Ensete ventricosum]RZS08394.1 hypothetical protein BHM03_00039362 [Ensete ventricosum]
MAMKIEGLFSAVLLLVLLLFRSHSATSQEVALMGFGFWFLSAEDESEFSYEEGSPNGPQHWGEIREEWAMCNNGDLQSPIDLLHERVKVLPGLGRLRRSYRAANATLKNRGHDIMVAPEQHSLSKHLPEHLVASFLAHHPSFCSVLHRCSWNGRKKQEGFTSMERTMSSNNVTGTLHLSTVSMAGGPLLLTQHHFYLLVSFHRFALELHMVHQSADERVAVVGIMYKIGRPDSFLTEVIFLSLRHY